MIKMAYILSKAPILCQAAFRKNTIFGPVTKIILVKNYQHLTNRTPVWAEQKFRLKDNISNDYKLIYREQKTMNFLISTAYNFGWLSLVVSVFLTGYIILINPPIPEKIEGILADGRVLEPLTKLGRAVVIFLGFVASIILIGSKSIPLRIYHNPTEKLYKAVFANLLFSQKQIITFGEGTVVPRFKRYFREILYNINGHTVLLDGECFPVPYARERMIRKTK